MQHASSVQRTSPPRPSSHPASYMDQDIKLFLCESLCHRRCRKWQCLDGINQAQVNEKNIIVKTINAFGSTLCSKGTYNGCPYPVCLYLVTFAETSPSPRTDTVRVASRKDGLVPCSEADETPAARLQSSSFPGDDATRSRVGHARMHACLSS